MEIEDQKNELLKQRFVLKKRQEIISYIIRKWTDNEIEDFLNLNKNLSIQTETEIKTHILDKNIHLFNKDELLSLNKFKNR